METPILFIIETPILKTCRICNIEKSNDEFQRNRRKCKKCIYANKKDYFLNYYAENKDEIKDRVKKIYHIKKHDSPETRETFKVGRKQKYDISRYEEIKNI